MFLFFFQELHQPACDAGVVLMNEIGLDPGIDHMLAMKCIDEVHSKGGKVGYDITSGVLGSLEEASYRSITIVRSDTGKYHELVAPYYYECAA